MPPAMKPLLSLFTAPERRQLWRYVFTVLLAVISWLALSAAPPKTLSTGWDKSNHALAFASLAFTLVWGWWPKPRQWGWVVLVLLSATPARAVTKEGTAEADRIQGSTGSDVVFGFEGDDVLRGKAGDDRLIGGRGDDLLKGGAGRDTYVCGTGFDVVVSDYPRRPDEHVGAGDEHPAAAVGGLGSQGEAVAAGRRPHRPANHAG